MSDVVVIGAGLSGLSIGYELALRGATVRIIERGDAGKAASWAGAGMLAPFTEEISDPAMLELCKQSLARYPQFVARLREDSGIDPHLQTEGIFSVAFDESQQRNLEARAHHLRVQGVEHRLLDRRETLQAEPALGSHACASLLVRTEGQVDNRRLGRALLAACERRGVTVSLGCGEVALEADARRVLGVRTVTGFRSAGTVVNAAGAWAARIEGVPVSCIPEVYPVKGQMLALSIPKNFVRRPIWAPHVYMVPRIDGRLLIGATVERGGFDVRVTAGAVHKLLSGALAAAPALAGFTLSEAWAGLRGASSHGKPVISKTSLDGYFLATGHFRNGILLAPMTGTMTADLIEGRANALAAPFALVLMTPEAVAR
ncbi:MAG: glycine oxidase ThiO [Candidatus Eremiobacteraeota bacterium]|nr:glycine oxidase ThiO [Candidatus Eremiobacteraeota bacterium]